MYARNRLLLGGLLLVLAVGLACPPSASAKFVENKELNFSIEVPEGWVEDAPTAAWAQYGLVFGAIRALSELKDGTAAKGEGAQVHLAVTKAPADKDLDALAEDPEVRGFLLNRFSTDPASWPEVEVISDAFEGGLGIRILRADGTSENLKGRPNETRAVMVLVLCQGRFYRLRMYAWHTERDFEGLKPDLDLIEVSFDILDKTEKAPEPEQGKPPPDVPEPEVEPQGDEAEEKVYVDEVRGLWKFVKPKGLQSKEFDRQKYESVVAWFESSGSVGSYQILFYVVIKGQPGSADVDLRTWAFDKWWPQFAAAHPEGALWTYDWPKKSKSFLTLPELEEKERVIFEDPSKRPVDADANDLMKKQKALEKVKNEKLGEVKTSEAYRAVLAGLYPRAGREVVVRYGWSTSRVTCMLVISLVRDARLRWAEPIQKFLESIELTER